MTQLGFEFMATLGAETPGVDAAVKEIGGLDKAIVGVDKSQKDFAKSISTLVKSVEIASIRLQRLSAESIAAKAASAQASAGASIFDDAMKSLGLSTAVTAAGVIAIGVAAVYAGEQLISSAVAAAEFKENAERAYSIVLDTGDDAKRTFAEISAIGQAFFQPVEQVQALAQQYAESGLSNQRLLESTVAATLAVGRAGLNGAKIRSIVENSESQGHFVLPKKLGGSGLDEKSLEADIATRLGVPLEQIPKMLKKGQIDAAVGIAAIDDQINSGKIGEIARQKFDLSDVTTALSNDWRSMTQDIDASPLQQSFRDFISIFDPGSASAQNMHDVLTFAINDTIKWVGEGVEAFTLFWLDIQIGANEAYIQLFPIIDALVRIERAARSAWHAMNSLTGNGGTAIGAPGEAAGVLDAYVSEQGALATVAKTLGGDVMMGLLSGIRAHGPEVSAAIAAPVTTGIDQARADSRTHSPSEEMADFGRDLMSGLEIGAEDGAPAAAAAVASASSAPAAGAAGGSGGWNVNVSVAIDMSGRGGSISKEDVKEAAQEGVNDALEELRLRLGQ